MTSSRRHLHRNAFYRCRPGCDVCCDVRERDSEKQHDDNHHQNNRNKIQIKVFIILLPLLFAPLSSAFVVVPEGAFHTHRVRQGPSSLSFHNHHNTAAKTVEPNSCYNHQCCYQRNLFGVLDCARKTDLLGDDDDANEQRLIIGGKPDILLSSNNRFDDVDWLNEDNDLVFDMLESSQSDSYFEDGGEEQFNQSLLESSFSSLLDQRKNHTSIHSGTMMSSNIVFSDVAYFYLRDDLGLSEDFMWKITFQAGEILGLKTQVLKNKVAFLQQALNITKTQVREMVQLIPAILGLSIEQNLKPTIEFLSQELLLILGDLGIKPHSALTTAAPQLTKLVLSSPAILCYSIPNLASKLDFFNTAMGFSKQERRSLLLAEPKILCSGLESGLDAHVQFLKKEMRIPIDKLRRIVQKNPRILMYSLNDNLRPKLIFYLIMTLHMEPRQVLKLLLAFPQFLDYNLEAHLLPTTRYFVSELEYSSVEFRNLLLKYPRVMTHSLYKIKHVVGYLRYELGLEASQVKRVIYQAPQLFGLSDANLQSKVEFVRETFSLDDVELRKVLASVPTLLVCTVNDNLQPKIDYLRQVFDNDSSNNYPGVDDNNNGAGDDNRDGGALQLRRTFLKLPALLVYSLERRLRPRLEKIVSAGISPSKITVGIPMKEANFETWLQRHQERGKKEEKKDNFDHRLSVVAFSDSVASNEKSIIISKKDDGRIIHWTRARRRAT